MLNIISKYNHAGNFFTLEEKGEILIFRVRPRQELTSLELGQTENLWNFFEDYSRQPKKAILVVVPGDLFGPESVKWITEHSETETPERLSVRTERLRILREENAFRRLISLLQEVESFVLVAFEGEVLYPFLGLVLAMDYRVTTEETVFINQGFQEGMPPFGALPWFLNWYVGQGRAARLLYERETFPAGEAREMGLVSALVPRGRLEQDALEKARWFAEKPWQELLNLKHLMQYTHLDLRDYLSQEVKLFERMIAKAKE